MTTAEKPIIGPGIFGSPTGTETAAYPAMDATTAHPTLLSAARNFIRKSAGTAVLAIAPLAAVSMAPDAKAQVAIFGGVTISGGTVYNSTAHGNSGSHTVVSVSGFFSAPLTAFNDVQGVSTGALSLYYSSDEAGTGLSTSTHFYSDSTASGTLADGLTIPAGYNFDITSSAGISNLSWSISASIYDSHYNGSQDFTIGAGAFSTGGGTVNFTGMADTPYTVTGGPTTLGPYAFDVAIYFTYDAASASDHVVISMIQANGQGITLNTAAIPEPSTYAALFGLASLGFVMLRRVRRCAA